MCNSIGDGISDHIDEVTLSTSNKKRARTSGRKLYSITEKLECLHNQNFRMFLWKGIPNLHVRTKEQERAGPGGGGGKGPALSRDSEYGVINLGVGFDKHKIQKHIHTRVKSLHTKNWC